jgi:hypothetical protein
MDIAFLLSDAWGPPGASGVPVFAYVESNSAFRGFSMVFDYDHTILELESITTLMHVGGEDALRPWKVKWRSVDPDGPRGGHVHCSTELLLSGPGGRFLYLPDPTEPVACLRFRIRDDAPPGAVAEINFREEVGNNGTLRTFANGAPAPDLEDGELRVRSLFSGKVIVELETSIFLFVRGDANGDHYVNLADAVFTLTYLFAGGAAPACPDAADANDDGHVNLADPITVLTSLFLPGMSIAEPYPLFGEDKTPDKLAPCRR